VSELSELLLQVREANQMVEEMMLLANISVAEKIVQHFPSCSLLRRHPTPAPRQFEPVVKAAASAGFTLEIDTSKVVVVVDKGLRELLCLYCCVMSCRVVGR
jgi:exosome complex exonuclease DIS3/RRP44